MRRPDEQDLSDAAVDGGEVGAGFGAVVDLNDGYGTYDEGFDDYDDESGSSLDDTFDDASDAADDSFDDGFGEGEGGPDTVVTEAEAEEILVDVLEEDHGSDADEVVDELQEATGMSAIELLEDITGIDIDGSDSARESGDGLDLLEMPEAERSEADDASD